ncbi:DUF4231 domain-containing protein [Mycoplasma procyoni]|uniref:DUF4231 domain-containing protein n=1 Tax=Mycoplasma procyoni TaxID=568784 RepID=UPI00197C243C|nr:DUF4231 domain-containing protein [Mycoplasma procyoni]MBN3534678.1 DUF4231 domain-containing protein [Mycoplasma procyoni]
MSKYTKEAFHKRFLELKNKTRIRKYVYSVLYYLLNITTFVSAFFVAAIAVYYLAGNNKYYPKDQINPYKIDFWTDSSNYILSTTIINALTSMISSFISFFVINTKYRFYKVKCNVLDFEYLLYKTKKGHYANESSSENDFRLYKRGLAILEINRYKSSFFRENELTGDQNGK